MSLDDLFGELDRRLADADAALAAEYPGDRGVRQPVHTVYVPADKYDASTFIAWGSEARLALGKHGGSGAQEVGESPALRAGHARGSVMMRLLPDETRNTT